MAILVAGGALAHSPLLNLPPFDFDVRALEAYKQAVKDLGASIQAQRPDVLLVFGQDHFRTLFYNLMPAFTIGTGRVEGWGDWGTFSGELNSDAHFARYLHRNLLGQGFDLACSYDLMVDHGVTQPVELLGLPRSIPLVPILVNTSAPPLPTPERCFQLGIAIARAIGAYDKPIRIAVLGSGGISHDPPMMDVESEDPANASAVRSLIHGRGQLAANEKGRQERLASAVKARKFMNSARPKWDRMILDGFVSGNAQKLASILDEASIAAEGGAGGQEIRTWLSASAVYGGLPAREICYYPIESLITGMGAVAFVPAA